MPTVRADLTLALRSGIVARMQHVAFSLPPDDQLEACHEQFLLHFVGHSPLTRDVAILEALIAELESLASSEQPSVAATAKTRVAEYRAERDRIAAAQAVVGPAGKAAARQLQQAGFIMHRYTRHFAGQPRATREAELLLEMNLDLQAVQANLIRLAIPEQVQEPLAQLDAHAQRLTDEHAAINASRGVGELAAQAAAWAGAANTLFAAYNNLCVGVSRLVVRPELMTRLMTGLRVALNNLRALQAQGLDAQDHGSNIALVESQLAMWEEEQQETLRVRRLSTPDEIMAALNEAMDTVLTEYNTDVASLSVTAPVLERLGTLCDRMDEIERQLADLIPIFGLTHIHAYNAVARDVLALLVGAFDHFSQALSEVGTA